MGLTYISISKAIHALILINSLILIQVRTYVLLLDVNLLYDEKFKVSNKILGNTRLILFITLLRVESLVI